MSGIDKIISKILEDAKNQAENTLNHANEEAARKKAEMESRYEKRMLSEEERAKDLADETYERIIANEMLEGRKLKLSAVRESVDSVFDNALKKLAHISPSEYIRIVSDMVYPYLTEGTNEIILSNTEIIKDPNDYDKLLDEIRRKAPGKTVVFSGEKVKSLGGVIIKNQKIHTNLTFEALIRLEKEKLESDVVKILFEGSN